MSDERISGNIKFYDSQKGWGFIRPDEPLEGGDNDVFLSNTRLPSGITTLTPGAKCEFTVGSGKRGLYAKEFWLL